MKFRRKTLHRLGLILLVLILLGGTGLLLAYRSHRATEQRIASDRKSGLAAYHDGDYARAIEPLERYLKERPDDTKIALAYARARFKVETNTNLHIKQAVEAIDGVLKREPDNLEAKHLLLEIYPQTANTDALERLSDAVLEKNPDDTLALMGRIIVRIRQSRLDEALATTLKYASLQPEDLKSRIRAIELMKAMKKSPEIIQEFADQQFAQNRMDPRHLLLQAFACNYRNDNDKALWFLQQAAQQPLTDSSFVQLLVSLFDQLKRYDESQNLLEAVSQRTGDPEIIRILIARLWQNGRNEEIVTRLEQLNPDDPRTDAELIALRTMALYQLGRVPPARELLKVLSQRPDRESAAWASALEARFEDYNHPPVVIAEKLLNALSRDPENGIFRTWLADCYWNLGEAALALRQWQAAALALPGWSKPYIGMSQALLVLGQTADAYEAAKAAVERVPNDASYINLAVVRFRLIQETDDLRAAKELLNLVSQIQNKIPGEAQTLPVYICLLSRTGDKEHAIRVLDRVASNPSVYNEDTLLQLLSISRNEGLDREQKLLDALSGQNLTPRLALTRASLLTESGKSSEALNWLKELVSQNSHEKESGWQLVLARFLDAIDDPSAPEVWRKLGDQYEKDLNVQREILAYARSIRKDRAFLEKTIQRLRDLTGNEGQQWRLEKARFLIKGPDIVKDGVEAALLLREVISNAPRQIEPRLLLAKTQELQGNITGAIDHLRTAQSVDPRSTTVTLELIRLLQQQGRTEEIKDALKQLSSTALMNPRQRIMLASLFADTGDISRAIGLLETDESSGQLLPPGRLLLAELYRRAGQTSSAERLYESLLAGESPSLSAIASAAEFFASRDDLPRAQEILSRLERVSAAPVEIALVRARFEEQFGNPQEALRQYRIARDTGTEAGIVGLIDFHLRQHDFAQAVAVARAGEQARADSTLIANRLAEAQALAEQKNDPRNLRPLIEALSRDPSRAAEVAALKVLQDFYSGKLSSPEAINQLRVIADRYPRFLPIQSQVIENYIENKKINEAVALARRTMTALPTDPEAARLAVRTLRVARLWNEMKLAAEQWKSRLTGNTLEADIAIAEALLETGSTQSALEQLSPYRELVEADVRTQPNAAVLLARALLAQNEGQRARNLLKPLLQDVSGRRMWQFLSVNACPSLPEAVQWMNMTESSTPAESVDEHYSLAKCWLALARKYDDSATLQRAVDRLADYLHKRPKDGEALLLIGGGYYELNQMEQAESAFRAILQNVPDHPAAANDLACLLLSQNRSLDEAEKLAQKAVSQQPSNPAFQDTLGRVLLARKKLDSAKSAFESALKMDPDMVAARVGYARTLKAIGDTTAAIRELKRADTQIRINPRLGKYLENELTDLRAQLSPGE